MKHIIIALLLLVFLISGCSATEPKTCEDAGGYCQSRLLGYGCMEEGFDFDDNLPCPDNTEICCAPESK